MKINSHLFFSISISLLYSILCYFLFNPSLIYLIIFLFFSIFLTYILTYFLVFKKFIFKLREIYYKITNNQYIKTNDIPQILNSIDIETTMLKNSNEELTKLENFRKDFIADISHELKTPIFAAQGFLHTLINGAIKNKNVRMKFLKKATRSIDRMDLMVKNLLAISQLETRTTTIYKENFDILELVIEVFEQLENKAEKKGISLQFKEKYDCSFFVYADFQRINQVLLNLVSNAIKYSRKNGAVTISIEEEEDSMKIMVSDIGRGIPQEDLEKIFQRFYRVEKSRSRDKGGTGLGLSIVKHILDAHDSKIFVESEVDKGSKFWFYLLKGKEVKNAKEEDDN